MSYIPSPTKASLYGAILFTLQQTRWLPVSKASLIFVFTMFMVSCKVSLQPSFPWDGVQNPGVHGPHEIDRRNPLGG